MITRSQLQLQQNTVPTLQDRQEKYACRRYGIIATHCQRPGTHPHHARLLCEACGVFIRWLPKPREFKGELPLTAKQLVYLKALEYADAIPKTRLQASGLIDALLKRKGAA